MPQTSIIISDGDRFLSTVSHQVDKHVDDNRELRKDDVRGLNAMPNTSTPLFSHVSICLFLLDHFLLIEAIREADDRDTSA